MAVIKSHRAAYRGRTVLVLGGGGFIGQHVVQMLSESGAEVHAVVRPGSPGPAATPHTATLEADLSRRGAISQVISATRPAITFNLAGYGIDPAERNDDLAASINVELVDELVRACGRDADATWPGQHLVHVGSALEYGTAIGDLHEGTTARPNTLYGRTKLAGTTALTAAVSAGTLRGVTTRLFTVYGPGEHAGRLLPSLIAALRTRAALALTAGTQRRDFTYVGDVAEGLLRLGCLADTNIGVVNLATGRLTSVRHFAERAADVIGLPRDLLQFGPVATRPEEMDHDDVSIARLVTLSGWSPPTGIEEGVRAALTASHSGPAS